VRLIRPTWDNSERYRELSIQDAAIVRERQREHERILGACAAGDGETAAAELRRHLTVTANLVAAQLGAPAIFAAPA
jgi:DNA-binding GntR family transcriptional regulator